MFKGQPKKQRTDYSLVEYGESYGAYGYSWRSTFEGVRSPGPLETDISLRRVTNPTLNEPEVQIAVELVQRYRTGSNSRRMHGSMTLRGEALREFCKRVLEEMPVTKDKL